MGACIFILDIIQNCPLTPWVKTKGSSRDSQDVPFVSFTYFSARETVLPVSRSRKPFCVLFIISCIFRSFLWKIFIWCVHLSYRIRYILFLHHFIRAQPLFFLYRRIWILEQNRLETKSVKYCRKINGTQSGPGHLLRLQVLTYYFFFFNSLSFDNNLNCLLTEFIYLSV